jgi:hypothetical protein
VTAYLGWNRLNLLRQSFSIGGATEQVAGSWLFIVDILVQSLVTSGEIHSGRIGSGAGFYPISSVFPR